MQERFLLIFKLLHKPSTFQASLSFLSIQSFGFLSPPPKKKSYAIVYIITYRISYKYLFSCFLEILLTAPTFTLSVSLVSLSLCTFHLLAEFINILRHKHDNS